MTELSEAQKKRMEESAYNYGEANSDYKNNIKIDLAFMNGYRAGLSDPSRSEALDKVLEEVEDSLSAVVSAEIGTFGSLSDSTHVGEAILNCEKVLNRVREIRKG